MTYFPLWQRFGSDLDNPDVLVPATKNFAQNVSLFQSLNATSSL
jgi:hypothetical protein